MVEYLVAMDVSATNILGGVYEFTHDGPREVARADYNGQDIVNFNTQVLDDLLKKAKLGRGDISRMVLAPAGPVEEGKRCQLTNAAFHLDADSTEIPTVLVNDFAAIAHAVAEYGTELKHVRLPHPLNDNSMGEVVEKAPMGIIGPGTGLGIARLFYNPGREGYVPISSEGGHCSVPFCFGDFMGNDVVRRISNDFFDCQPFHLEGILSGDGISRIYQALAAIGRSSPEPEFNVAEDQGKYVADRAKTDSGLHLQAMNLFWTYLGVALRNVVVHEEARGGVWIAGGITRKNIMTGGEVDSNVARHIMTAFDRGSSHNDWLRNIPVHVIMDEEVGLKGALAVACNGIAFEDYLRQD